MCLGKIDISEWSSARKADEPSIPWLRLGACEGGSESERRITAITVSLRQSGLRRDYLEPAFAIWQLIICSAARLHSP